MYERQIARTILARISEERKFIQVIAGPRQVGKTFAVKQALQKYRKPATYRLSESLGVNPLVWLETEWNHARLTARQQGEHLLVLDEIQKIEGWSERVKRLWDEDTFSGTKLKVVLLGSSRLLLQHGLNESLNGRFELIEAGHWSFAEMREAFGLTVEDYILYGGYPGAAELRNDETRWRAYIRDSIAEPSISTDILQMEKIAKPALLRQVFTLGCAYSARILSYQKMLGQLQEAGNATTLAHYLTLLGEAGLVRGLEKFFEEVVRTKSSSPKLAVCNTALVTAFSPQTAPELRARHDLWGHLAESAVGAHLLATAHPSGIEVLYWNVGIKEVDYILRKGDRLAALEVKSGRADDVSGMNEFLRKYPRAKSHLIGEQGMPLSEFFTSRPEDFL